MLLSMQHLALDMDDPPSHAAPYLPTVDAPSSFSFLPITATTITTAFTTATPATTTATTVSATAATSTPSSTCTPHNCPSSSRTCPPCKSGYICRLNVIDSSCQCPVANCVKIGFDTGENTGSGLDETPPPSKSVLAPILGGVAGLIVLVAIVFLIVRYRRHRRTAANGNRLLEDQEKQIHGAESGTGQRKAEAPSMDTFGINGDRKSDHNSLNQKDGQSNTIRIAYIPGIRNTEQFQTPELAHLGGAPQAFFVHENSNKHISVASSLSTGTLDEAIIMAVDKKATPKVFKLNSIKANNIDMIQRSNSLHSSNSIKRTQSQKRVRGNRRQHDRDDGRGNLEKIPNGPNPQDEEEDQQQQLQYTPAVVLTGPSARSSAQSTASDMTQKPKPPSMVLEPRPLHPNYHVSKPSSSPTSSKFEQTITTLTSAAITPNPFTNLTTESLLTTSSSSSPTLTALNSTLTSSTESKSSQVQADSKHSAEVLDSDEFRHAPWMHTDPTVPRLPHIRANSNSGSVTAGNPDVAGMNSPPQAPTTRNSTFSTQSARSGEEIMIFWDGHRHSRPSSASNL